MNRSQALRRARAMGRAALLDTEHREIEAALGRPVTADPPRVRGVTPKAAPEPTRRPRQDPVVVL